jgi:general secretion pathway protein A
LYNGYFGFQEKPFNVTPDPRFFYTNPVYQEAYASLLYGIRERKGFIVLTGEVGTGKTTLLRRLMSNPEGNVRLVFFYNTTLTFEELISFTCDELGLPVQSGGRLQKIQALNEFLVAQSKKGGTVVLLVDEAQHLTDDVLENLRLLSNLETASEKLLQIVLVGQSELDVKLSHPQLRQVKQRVALHCRLDRLKDREVAPFINYRLRVAGYEREDLFTADAIREVASYSKGIPRVINIICDNALLIAYATSAKKVSADVIREVANDLRLDTENRVADEETTTKTVAKGTKSNTENRANVKKEKLVSRSARRFKPVVVGSSVMVLLLVIFGGVALYHPDLNGWLSDLVLSKFDPGSGQSAIRPGLSIDSNPGSQGGTSLTPDRTSLASARQVQELPLPNGNGNGRRQMERSSPPPGSARPSAETTGVAGEQRSRSVVIQRGSTISGIAKNVYGADRTILAIDILKEFNRSIEDLNLVLAGQQLSLPPLTRETLLRRQPDETYRLILGSFLNSQGAENFGRVVRLKGYEVAITPRKVTDALVLHRVEIRGLKDLEGANQAWEVATANRWISLAPDSSPMENR